MQVGWMGIAVFLLSVFVWAQQPAPSPVPPKDRFYLPVRFRIATVVKIDPGAGLLTVKETVHGGGRERTYAVTKESKVMKDGKDAKLDAFKEGEAVLITATRRRVQRHPVLGSVADPVTFCSFLLYPTLQGTVKSFDPGKLTLLLTAADGKEHTLSLPGRGICCYAGGKGHQGKAGVWKGGESVVVVLSGPERARAVFDQDSWKVYGEAEWAAIKARRERRTQQVRPPAAGEGK